MTLYKITIGVTRNTMNNIAIIPARSGSKGVVDKNIRYLNGKPLMAYTIEAAIKSRQFNEVMVSTDSEKYADIARKYNASVPFLRSNNNANDNSSTWDVVDEVLNNYGKIGQSFDSFCLLQPTSPLRFADDIVDAYKLFYDKATFAVVSVCEAEHSPLWCGHLSESYELVDFIEKDNIKQRQANELFYRINGAIYIVDVKRYYNDKFFYQKGSFAYVMDQEKSIDIDTEFDFWLAEVLLNKYLV